MDNAIPKLYNSKEECCGCWACYSICISHAITMETDSEGFDYPSIDYNKCLRCNRCISVCPVKMAKDSFS